MVPQKERRAPSKSLGAGSVEDFDLDTYSLGRLGIVGYVWRPQASSVKCSDTEPADRCEQEQGENPSSVAAPGARYRRLFQSSTVSGKM